MVHEITDGVMLNNEPWREKEGMPILTTVQCIDVNQYTGQRTRRSAFNLLMPGIDILMKNDLADFVLGSDELKAL